MWLLYLVGKKKPNDFIDFRLPVDPPQSEYLPIYNALFTSLF